MTKMDTCDTSVVNGTVRLNSGHLSNGIGRNEGKVVRVNDSLTITLETPTRCSPQVRANTSKSTRFVSEFFVNPEPKITYLRKQTNKAYLIPYRSIIPSKESSAKTIDDLLVLENESDDERNRRRVLEYPLSSIHCKDVANARMGDSKLSGNLHGCEFDIDKELISGLLSCVTVRIPSLELRRHGSIINNVDGYNISLMFSVSHKQSGTCSKSVEINGNLEGWKYVFNYPFRPTSSGTNVIHISDQTATILCDFEIEVTSNNPVLSFNDASYWPVALAVDDSKKKREQVVVYVAYSHHITVFLGDGRYVQQLASLDDGSYFALALAPNSSILAAAVYSWNYIYRSHSVVMYHVVTGRKLYQVGGDVDIIGQHLSVASFNNDHVILIDGHSLCQMDVKRGDIIARLRLFNPGSISRACYHDNKYYVTDASSGKVKVYTSDTGELVRSILVKDNQGQMVGGLKGLVVDRNGNVIVSDCLTGGIWVYDADGQLIKSIFSEWEPIRWPLDLGVETNGESYLYVIDHGNICIKKFRYL